MRLERRKPDGINRCWALVIASAALFIPANVLPVMTVTQMGRGGPSTIMGGVFELGERGMFGLAFLVFMASIVVPMFKLGVLVTLLTMTQRRSKVALVTRTKLHRFVSLIGRWSMIDIFATMTLVALARFGWLGNVVPGVGASAFCAVVLTTMLAAETFDPRTMWDAAGKNPGQGATRSPARLPESALA
jgi:paraquat-inducible protein A